VRVSTRCREVGDLLVAVSQRPMNCAIRLAIAKQTESWRDRIRSNGAYHVFCLGMILSCSVPVGPVACVGPERLGGCNRFCSLVFSIFFMSQLKRHRNPRAVIRRSLGTTP
jgi:hypothetical protein